MDARGSFEPYPYRMRATTPFGRFEVEEGELETQAGTRPYTIVRMRPFVCVLPVLRAKTPEARAVLVRQFRYAVGAWQIEPPAGGIEQGETPEAAAVRELAEETGLVVDELVALGQALPSGGSTNERAWLYCARCSRATDKALDAGEQTECVSVRRSELEGMLGDPTSGYDHAVTFVLWSRMVASGLADAWLPRLKPSC